MQSKQSHSRHSSREKVSSNESTHRAAKSIGDASLCGIFVKADTAPDTVTDFEGNLPKTINILLFDSKETTFEFDHFRTISGHFFANYIITFQKT